MNTQTVMNAKLTESLLQKIAEKYSAKKILLVHGKKSFSLCGAKEIFDSAFSSDFQIEDFTDFSDNPKWNEIQGGLKSSKEFSPDFIIGVGGGSAMDVAKQIRFFSAYDGLPNAKAFSKYSELIPLVLVPTTAGSGAESTHFAVCFKDEVKFSVSHDDILADEVVLDWTLTNTNSDYITACTGFDALAQAIESYWAIKSTEQSRKLAKQAIEIIFPILNKRELYHTDDFRKRMMLGANLSGQAINISTTTACHAFSYKITSLLGLPHGHAVAVSLPYFFDYCFSNAESELRNRMQDLNTILGIASEPRIFLSDYVKQVFSGLYIPRIPTNEEWNSILNSVNNERLANYPLPLGEIKKDYFLW